MIPITFGTAGRQLFGVYHPAQAASTKIQTRGVLLCNPWGQEAIRAHRLLRVLADRLARSGVHVLRFDYFGTGDSAGSDEEGDLKGWAQDILQAHLALQAQSQITDADITWLGVRLGALLVIQAASATSTAASSSSPARLLLWDPVLDGPAYLELLATKHAENLQAVYSLPPFLYEKDPRQTPPGPIQEALGFGICAALHGQLMATNPDALLSALPPIHTHQDLRKIVLARRIDDTVPRYGEEITTTPERFCVSPIHIIASDETLSAQLKKLQINNSSLSIQHLAHDFDWTAEEAMNTALVPAQAIQCLVSCVLDIQKNGHQDFEGL
jgi:uncharacterized protein